MSALPPLVLGSEDGRQFQQLIKQELVRRQWSDGDDDEVMAEYILVMLANNKTAEQIAAELEELVGDASTEGSGSDNVKVFVDWLWHERATIGAKSDISMEGLSGTTSSDARSREQWRVNEMKRRSLSPARGEVRDGQTALQARNGNDGRNGRGGDRWGDERQRRDQNDRSGRYTRNDRNIPFPDAQNTRGQMASDAISRPQNGRRELLNGHNGNSNSHAAMDDPSLQRSSEQSTSMRILGQGSNLLFQRSLAQSSRQQNQQPQAPSSIFSRVSMPDPRAQEFVPSSQVPVSVPLQEQSSSNLLSRLDPMMPTNQMPSSLPANDSLTNMHDSSFPLQPTDASLCRYSLSCTNPMCCFSHPSASAVSQHQKTGKEPLVLRQEPCRFQKDCTNIECSFSHVSPAVTFVMAKAERKIESLNIGSATPCHFQMECKNPACTYAHFDATTGEAVPSPALQYSEKASNAVSTEAKPCKFGLECTRKGCHFSHPLGHSLHISDRLSQFGGHDGEMEVIIPAS